MSWLILGGRITKIDALHPVLQRVARAALKRGLRWQAYHLVEEDKYRNKRPAGQWLWVPKARIIGHLELPSFGTFEGGRKYAIRWSRSHPLARSLKEVWQIHQWGDPQLRRWARRRGPRTPYPAPSYEHWLEAREVAEREGRTIAPFEKWREELSSAWHWDWYQSGSSLLRRQRTSTNPRRRKPGRLVGYVRVYSARVVTASLKKSIACLKRARLRFHVDFNHVAGRFELWVHKADHQRAMRACGR